MWLLMVLVGVGASFLLLADDPELANKSTLETIRARGTLIVCSDIPYTPFEFKDEKGNLVGFDVDLARLMAKFIGVKLDIRATVFDVIIPELRKGSCDIIISGMTRTLERGLQVNFTSDYLASGQIVAVSKARKPALKSYGELNQPGIIITVQTGTTGEFAAKANFPKATIKGFDNAELALQEVVLGRADAIVFDDVFLLVEFVKFSDKIFLCCPPGKPEKLTAELLGFAIRKGDPDFLTWLDLFVEQTKSVILINDALAKEFEVNPVYLGKPIHPALVCKWFTEFPARVAKQKADLSACPGL